jgi:hypothetical protein
LIRDIGDGKVEIEIRPGSLFKGRSLLFMIQDLGTLNIKLEPRILPPPQTFIIITRTIVGVGQRESIQSIIHQQRRINHLIDMVEPVTFLEEHMDFRRRSTVPCWR